MLLSSSDEELDDEGVKSKESSSKEEQAKTNSEEGAKSKDASSEEEQTNSISEKGLKSKDASSKEEQSRLNSDLPSELTVGALSSLWNPKSGVTPLIRPSMGKSVNEITRRLQLGPSDSKDKWQGKKTLIPDLELRLAEQPRHTSPAWHVLVRDASASFPAPNELDVVSHRVSLLAALEGGGDFCYLSISPGPPALEVPHQLSPNP